MSLFSHPHEPHVYISATPDGHRSISIHGDTLGEVAELMHQVLDRLEHMTDPNTNTTDLD